MMFCFWSMKSILIINGIILLRYVCNTTSFVTTTTTMTTTTTAAAAAMTTRALMTMNGIPGRTHLYTRTRERARTWTSASSNLLGRRSSSGYGTSSTGTSLQAFLWFGGNDGDKNSNNKNDENNNDNDNRGEGNNNNGSGSGSGTVGGGVNLVDVATIMDSMTSFRTSQRAGERASTALQDLSNTYVEGTAADGKVKIVFNGQQKPMSVSIDESYLRSLISKHTDDGSTSSSSSGSGSSSIGSGSSSTGSSNHNHNNNAADELSIALTRAMEEAHIKSSMKMEERMKSLYTELGFDTTTT